MVAAGCVGRVGGPANGSGWKKLEKIREFLLTVFRRILHNVHVDAWGSRAIAVFHTATTSFVPVV
jgi:hypothetical protein